MNKTQLKRIVRFNPSPVMRRNDSQCDRCKLWVHPKMKDCQPCPAAQPTYSRLHVFTARSPAAQTQSFGKDVLGHDIRVGCIVAYNRSGNVDRGRVKEIRRVAVPWCLGVNQKACYCRIRNSRDNKISTVRWPSSILVIHGPIPDYEVHQ
jgi:hypothetical protein